MQLLLIRGLVAIAWAVVFAAASDSLTTDVALGAGILLVRYPLIDVVASLTDARSQRGSAQRLLRLDAATSAVAAFALGVAATGTVADVLAVFGAWAFVTGAAQLIVALRRRALFGNQWPMLIAGGASTVGGIAWVLAAAGDNPTLAPLVLYAAAGGTFFVVQARLLAGVASRPCPPDPSSRDRAGHPGAVGPRVLHQGVRRARRADRRSTIDRIARPTPTTSQGITP